MYAEKKIIICKISIGTSLFGSLRMNVLKWWRHCNYSVSDYWVWEMHNRIHTFRIKTFRTFASFMNIHETILSSHSYQLILLTISSFFCSKNVFRVWMRYPNAKWVLIMTQYIWYYWIFAHIIYITSTRDFIK